MDFTEVWLESNEAQASPGHFIRGEVLLDAYRIINTTKRDAYGDPEDSFPALAKSWTVYLKAKYGEGQAELSGVDVALMMVLLKIIRAAKGYKDDTYVDAAGYIGLASDQAKDKEEG